MKKKKTIFLVCIAIVITICIGYIIFQKNKIVETYGENQVDNKNIQIEETYANLTDVYIYGTHLNIEGKIELINENIENLKLILANEQEQLEYNLKYKTQESHIDFTSYEYINRGIDLEKISKEKYAFLLKLEEKSGKSKYYSFNINDVKIEELEYYSLSNNNRTNYITLKEIEKEENSYFILYLENMEMPENVYDITLDAGHGGSNPGAVYNGYYESDIVLDYVIKLKEMLEVHGLKVALTRSEDIRIEEYGENGRAVIPNKVKSKYTFSIHLNSTASEVRNGVEIYSPSKAELSFSKLLAKNIVECANTTYSQNEVDKVYDGVYVRTFTKEDIEQSNKDAAKDGYESYNITEYTPYLFMIRETGAKITNAYVDGRNKEYGTNIYYNSSVGNESYLLELGYINSDIDLNNLLNNKAGYLKGIVQSILNLTNRI